jgi:hypothetical protein
VRTPAWHFVGVRLEPLPSIIDKYSSSTALHVLLKRMQDIRLSASEEHGRG